MDPPGDGRSSGSMPGTASGWGFWGHLEMGLFKKKFRCEIRHPALGDVREITATRMCIALGVAMRGVLVFSGNHGGGGGLGDPQRLLCATGLSYERRAPV